MLHLKLTIAYDGTGLVGWQRQPAGSSVQGLLEEALAALEGRPVTVAGAGRTDAGVHALGQVASVMLHRPIEPLSVMRAINTRLPPSVRVLSAEEVPPGFHAQFEAMSKTYRYRIWNADVVSPFERQYVWHLTAPRLDAGAMATAAVRLEGVHDFAAFECSGSEPETTVRTIFSSRVSVDVTEERLLIYEVRGDGFLRHMVRAIAGTLVEIGRGRQPAVWIDEVLASRDRQKAGRTAPPSGLFLVEVQYK